jgi:hypothetical protein
LYFFARNILRQEEHYEVHTTGGFVPRSTG